MSQRIELPFESIENAQRFVRLLTETVAETRRDIDDAAVPAPGRKSDRRIEALRLVAWHLEKLERHLSASVRTLNDLRSLRRLLFEERSTAQDTELRSSTPAPPVPLIPFPIHARDSWSNDDSIARCGAD